MPPLRRVGFREGEYEMKTPRDIKSSLELGRNRRAPSRTHFIEAAVRKELEGEFREILSDDERAAIEERESRRVEAYKLALKRSKLRILRAKERARILQDIRSGKRPEGAEESRRANPRRRTRRSGHSARTHINEISYEY